MSPFLLLFGLIGISATATKWWKWPYGAYWAILVVTAALHPWLTAPLNG